VVGPSSLGNSKRFRLLACLPALHAQYYLASTIAGNGQLQPAPSGGLAINARLVTVRHVAADAAGNAYVSDAYFNQVLQITPAGVINVFAGAGQQGSSGDGGPAIAALLDAPGALAVDAAGNLYIADTANSRIRMVTPGGTISTFANTGASGLTFDTAGNLYITTAHSVRRITPTGTITTIAGTGTAGFSGDGAAATSATLNTPTGLRFDSEGNLFIADRLNHRIRRVTPAGIISTIAGDGIARSAGDNGPATSASLSSPSDVALDAANNLYIAETNEGRVRLINRQSGNMTTAAGGGTSFANGAAGDARLTGVSGLAFDSRGGLLIALNTVRQVRRLFQSSITTIAGVLPGAAIGDNRPATETSLLDPFGVAVEANGNVLVSDNTDQRIRRISPAGILTNAAGTGLFGSAGNNGQAPVAEIGAPRGLAVDSAGNIFVSTGASFAIRRINTANVISTIAGAGPGFSGDNGPAFAAMFQNPLGLAADSAGNVYVTDNGNNRIRRIAAANQIISTVAGSSGVGFSGDGGPATSAQLSAPQFVATDRANNLYIADTQNHRVRRVTPQGVISTVAGNGSATASGDGGPATEAGVNAPLGIAVDSAGHLYIATGSRIRKVDAATQNISTIAGGTGPGFSGDGGLAANARFDVPRGIAVDAAGAVYVADSRNFRVRKLTPARIVAEGVTNAATSRPGPVAPGQIVSIFGFDLGPAAPVGLQLDSNGRVATTLGGTRVTFDGVPAPLLFVSANQVNTIVPYGVNESTRLQVTYQDRPTNTITLPVTASSPGVFAITNQDGSVNSAANRAGPGSVLVIYGTGEGQTTPAGVDGAVSNSVFPKPNLPVTVTIGGRPAEVLYAGAAPGFVSGVLQLNVTIPAGVSGTVPLVIRVGEAATPAGLNVNVQ